jgi:hypothetical protein
MNYTQQNSSDSQIENTRVINSKSVVKLSLAVASSKLKRSKRLNSEQVCGAVWWGN